MKKPADERRVGQGRRETMNALQLSAVRKNLLISSARPCIDRTPRRNFSNELSLEDFRKIWNTANAVTSLRLTLFPFPFLVPLFSRLFGCQCTEYLRFSETAKTNSSALSFVRFAEIERTKGFRPPRQRNPTRKYFKDALPIEARGSNRPNLNFVFEGACTRFVAWVSL